MIEKLEFYFGIGLLIKSFLMFKWRYVLHCTLNVNFIFCGSAGKGDNLLPLKRVHVFLGKKI